MMRVIFFWAMAGITTLALRPEGWGWILTPVAVAAWQWILIRAWEAGR
jgi:hypothetical protein